VPKSPIAGLAVAFKVVNDPQRGMLTFVRVYHGTLARNSPMWNSTRQTFEKSLNMLHIAGAKTQDIPSLSVGGIGALTGLKEARTGDTLVVFAGNPSKAPESLRGISIRPPEIPPAVAFVAIHPHTVSGSKALATALESASREDPSLRWTHDDRLDRFVLSGLGTLHLDICQDRLKTFYKVDAEFGKIEVDYKESLTVAQPPLRYVFDGVVAGKAGSAACTATLEPLPRDDEGNEIAGIGVDSTRDGNIIEVTVASEAADAGRRNEDVDTDLLRQQLFNGALAALSRGPLRGSPLHGLKVKIDFDPATDMLQPSTGAHVVGAATQAVRRALKEALNKGEMAVMEPFMKVLIQVPEDVGGAVEHDLAANRGGLVLEVNDLSQPQAEARPSQTQGQFLSKPRPTSNKQPTEDDDGGVPIDLSKVYIPPDPYESVQTLRQAKRGAVRMLEIVARVPLREVLEYDGHLRSVTAGRHSLHMELDRFEVSRKA
jgi:elongation factor G